LVKSTLQDSEQKETLPSLYSVFILDPFIFSPLIGQTVSFSFDAKDKESIAIEETMNDVIFFIMVPFYIFIERYERLN
jgi:hypothetical protein